MNAEMIKNLFASQTIRVLVSEVPQSVKLSLEASGYVFDHNSGIYFDLTGDEDDSLLDSLAFYIISRPSQEKEVEDGKT